MADSRSNSILSRPPCPPRPICLKLPNFAAYNPRKVRRRLRLTPSNIRFSAPQSTLLSLPDELLEQIYRTSFWMARICPRCRIVHGLEFHTWMGMRLLGIGPLPLLFTCKKVSDLMIPLIYSSIDTVALSGHFRRTFDIKTVPFDLRPCHPDVQQYAKSIRITVRIGMAPPEETAFCEGVFDDENCPRGHITGTLAKVDKLGICLGSFEQLQMLHIEILVENYERFEAVLREDMDWFWMLNVPSTIYLF